MGYDSTPSPTPKEPETVRELRQLCRTETDRIDRHDLLLTSLEARLREVALELSDVANIQRHQVERLDRIHLVVGEMMTSLRGWRNGHGP
jgi:hypothetical protein